jgi:Zn-dependent M28 family amino/carboxypeptidase
MSWINADDKPYTMSPNLRGAAYISQNVAPQLYEGARLSWEEILNLISDEEGVTELPSFDLPIIARLDQASVHGRTKSNNVIGIIEGADPALKDEAIVLSAHIDHIGITRKSFAEDVINNGALDNAVGVATLLEVARAIKAEAIPPRRSIVFAVVTAEEKGLIGSQYFAMNSTLGDIEMVANINLDMPVLTYDFRDVVAFGGERSTMKSVIENVATDFGIRVAEDLFPDQGLFTRSDHYRFVEVGVPSVFLATGFENGGRDAWATHFAKNYHMPSDEVDNGVRFDAAERFADINTKIAIILANQDDRPKWVAGDFFAQKFGGIMHVE